MWLELHRQVRIEGVTERLSRADSDAYFESRPRDAQLAASISVQSAPITGRAELERAFAEAEARAGTDPLPRPSDWGGYLVVPHAIEFWRGRRDRLHDRVLFQRAADGWTRERLAP